MVKFQYLYILAACLIGTVFLFDRPADSDDNSFDKALMDNRIYEMRTYTTNEGKLDALHQRFSNHTMDLFEKHGMVNIGYWTPTDPSRAENTLIYIISHESREAAEKSWEAFRADPEWQEAYQASRVDGVIVKEVESVFMTETPYSPLK